MDIAIRLAAFAVLIALTAFFVASEFAIVKVRNTRLSEAPSHGKSIFDYDMQCEGSRAYVSLAKEVIDNNKGE